MKRLILLVLTLCCLAPALPVRAEIVREPILAGEWYPADPAALRASVSGLLQEARNKGPLIQPATELLALIAPHAGHRFSGPVASHAYAQLTGRDIATVVLIAPSHKAAFEGVSVYDAGGYRTPLGVVGLDWPFIKALRAEDGAIRHVPEAHAREHAIEIQLPFVQLALPMARIVPLVMGSQDLETAKRLAHALALVARGKKTLFVASSDQSHYHNAAMARTMDMHVMDSVRGLAPEALHGDLAAGRCEACGGGPMLAAMLAARELGADTGTVLAYGTSGDVTGDDSRVVGYLSAAFTKGATGIRNTGIPEITATAIARYVPDAERALLHEIAHNAVRATLAGKHFALPDGLPPLLRQPGAAFVTLKKAGRLRGCIGMVKAVEPLADCVAGMARAAAFSDPRFPAVRSTEFEDLDFEISVLTPLEQVADVHDIKVGTHGVMLRRGTASGLLLPQVAPEQGWNRAQLLDGTCRKAGLAPGCWRDANTQIYRFAAEVF